MSNVGRSMFDVLSLRHTGLLPKYRLLVEKLTARSLLKVGSDFPLCKFHDPRYCRA